MSARKLRGDDADVVICSYDVAELSWNRNKRGQTAPLHSSQTVWKAVYLIDSHLINNTKTTAHVAIRKLNRLATICVTDNPIAENWSDIYGAISLLQGHPWTDLDKFKETFQEAAKTKNLTKNSMKLLTKFIKAQVVIDRVGDEDGAWIGKWKGSVKSLSETPSLPEAPLEE